MMKRIRKSVAFAILFMCSMFLTGMGHSATVHAANITLTRVTIPGIWCDTLLEDGTQCIVNNISDVLDEQRAVWVYYDATDFSEEELAGYSDKLVQYTSSNPDVLYIDESTRQGGNTGTGKTASVKVTVKSAGYSDFTISVGDVSQTYRIYAVERGCVDLTVEKNGVDTVKLSWDRTCDGMEGYAVYRQKAASEDVDDEDDTDYAEPVELVEKIEDIDTTSCILTTPWDQEYDYAVYPYITVPEEIEKYFPGGESSEDGFPITLATAFTLESPTYELKAKVASSSKGTVTCSWPEDSVADSYTLYKADRRGGPYKKLTETTKNSYTLTVTKGSSTYYKVAYHYGVGTYTTAEQMVYMPLKTSSSLKKVRFKSGFYTSVLYTSGAVGTTRRSGYYERKGVLHFVIQKKGTTKLYDYTLYNSGKVKSVKTVKLGSFDSYGGFYYGTDGYYYVLTGYDNLKESETKTVIKIRKYNSSWKLVKTASVKGAAENWFDGIRCVFNDSCDMDMSGDILYIHTCRSMFKMDGIAHQSNISFALNTKTMKVTTENHSYVSHSFNQYARFQGGNLYLLDHGDAYPRGLNLTTVRNYGTDTETESESVIFKFNGNVGNNNTGTRVCGMEVGTNNIITTGISVPHNHSVKGIKGYEYSYLQNAYVTLTNKKTGKTTFKWLTTYKPTSTSVSVSETNLVKINDNRFMVLYTITTKKKMKLYTVLMDDTGKILKKKSYSNILVQAGTQAVVHKGRIYFFADKCVRKKMRSIWGTYYWGWKASAYQCSIPTGV